MSLSRPVQNIHPLLREDDPLRLTRYTIAAVAAFALNQFSSLANAQEAEPVIQDGSTVSIEYTLKLDDGSVADTRSCSPRAKARFCPPSSRPSRA